MLVCLGAVLPPLPKPHKAKPDPVLHGAALLVVSPTTPTKGPLAVPTLVPKPRTIWLAWDAPVWPHELEYEVWAQWPVWVTNRTFHPAGVFTNHIGKKTIISTNLVSYWQTNASWSWSLPVYWMTTTNTRVQLDPSTNAGGLFRVRDRDPATGLESDWAK